MSSPFNTTLWLVSSLAFLINPSPMKASPGADETREPKTAVTSGSDLPASIPSQPISDAEEAEEDETPEEMEIRILMTKDRYKDALKFIDGKARELGNKADFYRARIFASAEKRAHGFAADPAKAVALYKQAVDAGNGWAAVELAAMYRSGDGVPESEEQSVLWLKKASSMGEALGHFELANYYYDNEGHPNAGDIVSLLHKLTADATFRGTAFLKLGRVYCRGKCGVKIDVAKGMGFLEMAAELGKEDAFMDLAHLYYQGKHVPRDLRRSLELAEKAGPDHMLYEDVIEKIRGAMKSSR